MAKVKVRRSGEAQPSPEYFFRIWYGTLWHVGTKTPTGMNTRCGLIGLDKKIMIRPAGGINKCTRCYEGDLSTVNTDTIEELEFGREE